MIGDPSSRIDHEVLSQSLCGSTGPNFRLLEGQNAVL